MVAGVQTGDTVHEFEVTVKTTELTPDAPNQLAIDFVDLSVFPVGGRSIYSLKKNGSDVFVENVDVTAQPIGSTSLVRTSPSTKSLTNGKNFTMPLFAGKYLFLAERPEHDIRIKADTPGYDPNT